MTNLPTQQWFEMEEVRRRRLALSVWIPLRQSETIEQHGDERQIGSRMEIACTGSVAISNAHRALGDRLGWMDIGLIHDPGPYAFKDGRYKAADVYLHNDREAIGVELVLVQSLNSAHPKKWLINQDLVLALRLVEEGDVWRRADEGYVDVIRSRRDSSGKVVAIEIRSEFLRDYLCARGLALRVAQYRQRMAIVADPSYLPWAKEPKEIETNGERFSARVFEVDADGDPFGGSFSVMKVWRTDVDKDEDVPVFGPESDENTAFESASYERTNGPKVYRAEGELWREEWIEAAAISERVRGDNPSEEFYFFVDAAGKKATGTALNNEDVGRWLWFRPKVIEALISFRGSALGWYTRQTGWVKCSPDFATHFGINDRGCINVYAFDIAKLPHWQQRVWVGHNVAPDGPVSSELLDAQMRTTPASTEAPEVRLAESLKGLDEAFTRLYGSALFSKHPGKGDVLARVHRFRALEPGGILALAKDVARLTADSIDVGLLRRIVKPPMAENWRSLKLLEHTLARSVGADVARDVMAPLVGIYELRLGDAHLPSSKLIEAFELVQIDAAASPLDQGTTLIEKAAMSLRKIADGLR